MNQEETDDNSHESGIKTMSSACLESNREAVAIADSECGSAFLEGKLISYSISRSPSIALRRISERRIVIRNSAKRGSVDMQIIVH
jgi:hypothetical protein